MNSYVSTPSGPARTVATYVQMLSRRKYTALITLVAIASVLTCFILGLPPLYRSTATVMVEGQLAEPFSQEPTADIDNRLQIIKQQGFSRAHLTELLDDFHLYPTLRGRIPTEL